MLADFIDFESRDRVVESGTNSAVCPAFVSVEQDHTLLPGHWWPRSNPGSPRALVGTAVLSVCSQAFD